MLVAGNWKMNLDLAAARQLASSLVTTLGDPGPVRVAVCPPFVNLDAVFSALYGSPIRLGAQNMHESDAGAFTGEVSAAMLRAVGCHYVILGHSERRQYFGESDEGVQAKAKQALTQRLVPIVCVGETLEERDGGREFDVVEHQVRTALDGITVSSATDIVLAYEPVWAIGTGRTATPEQAQQIHARIRSILVDVFGRELGKSIDILYGGSMKPSNAAELLAMKDVCGGLIGGAALNADDFAAIVAAAKSA